MNSGYSLIEMLVVLALIALIATLTIPRLTRDNTSTSAYAVSLSSYLNTAGHYAHTHESQVCVSRQGENVTTIPQTQEPLPVPTALTLQFTDYCYDSRGRVSSTQDITVQSKSDSTDTSVLTLDPLYGNVRPK